MKNSILKFIVCILICLMPMTVYATDQEQIDLVSYDDANSFQITVKVDEKTEFTPEDFPEVACTDVYVASLSKDERFYYYTLILVCEDVEDINIEKDKLKNINENIFNIQNNQYVTKVESSILNLSSSVVFLEVGESVDITIDELILNSDSEVFEGIYIQLDPEKMAIDTIDYNILKKCGVKDVYTKKQADNEFQGSDFHLRNYGTVNGENYIVCTIYDNISLEAYVNTIHNLAQMDGVEEIDIVTSMIVGGFPIHEKWTIASSLIASVTEFGGVPYSDENPILLNKSGTVTALKPGIATLEVNRCEKYADVLGTCKIVVLEEGATPALGEFKSNGVNYEFYFTSEAPFKGGSFILNCNPNVLEIVPSKNDNVSIEQLEDGKYKISFEGDENSQNSFFGWIGFQVINSGAADFSIESASLYDAEGTIYNNFLKTENYENFNFDIPSWEYDESQNKLYIKQNLVGEYKFRPWGRYISSIESIVFADDVELIYSNILNVSPNLKDVYIPSSVRNITPDAFPKNNENQVILHGKSMSLAEEYAYQYGYGFVPTNDQLRGDINENGEYEAVDALDILKMVVNLETTYGYSGDADANGEVTAEDALLVLQKVVKLVE